MALHLSQHDSPAATALLKQSLENNPSVLPPLPLLTSLCQAMDTPQDVQLVIRTLLFTNTMVTCLYEVTCIYLCNKMRITSVKA